jgi:hypothetical protein
MKKRNFTVMAFRAGLNPAARAAFDEIDSPDRRRMAKAIAFDRPLFKINRNAEKKSV